MKAQADKGNIPAMVEVGSMYAQGEGVSQNYAKAREYFTKAANNGSVDGMIGFGSLYRGGFGVNEDCEEASKWYRKAAYEGSQEGADAIAHLYFTGGRNLSQSYYNSYIWCCVAEMADKSEGAALAGAVVGGGAALLLSGPLLPLAGIGYLWADYAAERSIKEQIEGKGIFNLAKLSGSAMDSAKIEAGKIMAEIERNIKDRKKKK